MQNHLTKMLSGLGLDEKQAKVYLACLELGSATIQKIAQKAGVKRTSIYNFIDELIKFGLISKTQKDNRYYFLAETPETLKGLQEKRQELLEKAMPALIKKFELSPIITNFKYFRGQEGVRKIWKETLNVKNKELLWTTANEATIDLVGKRFTENYIAETKKGI